MAPDFLAGKLAPCPAQTASRNDAKDRNDDGAVKGRERPSAPSTTDGCPKLPVFEPVLALCGIRGPRRFPLGVEVGEPREPSHALEAFQFSSPPGHDVRANECHLLALIRIHNRLDTILVLLERLVAILEAPSLVTMSQPVTCDKIRHPTRDRLDDFLALDGRSAAVWPRNPDLNHPKNVSRHIGNLEPVLEGILRVLGLGGVRDLILLLTEASTRREGNEAPEEGHRENGHEPNARDGCHASHRCEVLDAERAHGRRYASQGRTRDRRGSAMTRHLTSASSTGWDAAEL